MEALLNDIKELNDIISNGRVSNMTTKRLDALHQAQFIADTYRAVKETLVNDPALTYSQGKELELVLAQIMAIHYGGCGPSVLRWYEFV